MPYQRIFKCSNPDIARCFTAAIRICWFRKLPCPVPGIFGDKDRQVPAVEDYNLLKANLSTNKYSEVAMIKNMSHFMQPDSTTGSWNNYEKIPATIMPGVLDKMVVWVY